MDSPRKMLEDALLGIENTARVVVAQVEGRGEKEHYLLDTLREQIEALDELRDNIRSHGYGARA